ncbi:MAG TPA: alpha/beta fold hydrolase [Hyphomicrobiaceae bacterium]|nr:alpha/beta fold hydrolase [Hyphomicrobiaceae bacterium]
MMRAEAHSQDGDVMAITTDARVDDFVNSTRFSLDGVIWPNATMSRLVDIEGRVVHIQQMGRGPPALLIHGTGASTHSWEGLVDELAADLHLTLVDLPGHGFSAPAASSDMSLEGYARSLARLVSVLGIAPQLVIAHSAGAAVAVRMALDGSLARSCRIIAINGAFLPFGGLGRWLFPPMARLLAAGPFTARLFARHAERAGAVERLLIGTGGKPPQRSIGFYRLLLKQPAHVQSALDMMANWSLERLSAELPRLRAPLDLVACGDDRAVPAETAWTVKSLVAGASVHYLRDAGHLAHEEQPAAVAAIVRGAIAGLASCGREEPLRSTTGRHSDL